MVGIIYTFFLVNGHNVVIDYTKKELLTYRLITSLWCFKILSIIIRLYFHYKCNMKQILTENSSLVQLIQNGNNQVYYIILTIIKKNYPTKTRKGIWHENLHGGTSKVKQNFKSQVIEVDLHRIIITLIKLSSVGLCWGLLTPNPIVTS